MSNVTRPAALIVLLALGIVSRAPAAEVEPCVAAFQAALPTDGSAGPAQAFGLLNNETQSGCIRGATDTTGVEAQVVALRNAPTSAEVSAKRAQLFDTLLAQFGPAPPSACEGDSTACIVGRQTQSIRDVRQLLENGQPHFNDPMLNKSAWTVVLRDGGIGISNVHLQPYLARECSSGLRSTQCMAAIEAAARIMRSTFATLDIITAHSKPIIDAAAQFLSTRDKEWDSYFNEVSVQYPWELALNSWQFQKSVSAPERAAFPRAPESKYIALHPVAAFERAKSANGDRGTQAAVVVEVFGYERWRWREGTAVNRMGASLAVSFADIPGADKVGYGLVVHTPIHNASLGVVWRNGSAGDSVNLIFNVDLAKLIEQYKTVDVRDFVQASP